MRSTKNSVIARCVLFFSKNRFEFHADNFLAAIEATGIKPKAVFLTSAPSNPEWVFDNKDISKYVIGPTQVFISRFHHW